MKVNYSRLQFNILPKSIIITLAIISNLSAIGQSIPNGGFENWNMTTWIDPQYYQTSNDNSNNGVILVNAIQTTDAFHGSYAIKMTCLKSGLDTVGGYVIDGNPGQGTNVQGGIPYNQMATGISLHYKYTIKSADTALVIIFFKLRDTVINQYIFKVYDTTSNYKLFAATFSPALTKTPDTVVFGAATSIKIMGHGGGIPGSVLTIDSVNFTGVTSQPTDLNGDFENWSPTDTALIPAQWEVSSHNARTTDAASGKYALELVTVGPNRNNSQVQNGYADDGIHVQVSSHHDSTEGGYPYSQLSDSIVFDYKYTKIDTSDRATINLQFNKNSKVINGRGWNLNAASTWTHVSFPFTLGTAPDSVIVFLQSSSKLVYDSTLKYYVTPSSCIGADFKVDSLTFGHDIITGIQNNTFSVQGIKVYPNPNNGKFTVEAEKKDNISKIEVFNLLGEKIYSADNLSSMVNSWASPNASVKFSIDLSLQPTGTYFVKAYAGNSVTITKFIKQ